MIVIIFDFNRTLYDPDGGKLMDGALELLENLSKKFHIILLAKGDEKRMELINSLKIAHFFKEIILVPGKNIEQMLVIKEKFPDGTTFFCIGDRIKKEIKFGNMLGFKTIWLKNGKFASEIPLSDDEKPWQIINSLEELSMDTFVKIG